MFCLYLSPLVVPSNGLHYFFLTSSSGRGSSATVKILTTNIPTQHAQPTQPQRIGKLTLLLRLRST
eukprot:scaffold43668_cov818-Skeletonema_marinoi.AAC.1